MATSSSVAGTLTETAVPREENTTLKLKLKKKKPTKKIQWTEDTVDNEGLGKKKSKVCCQYTKPRTHLDQSSSEEEEEEGDHHGCHQNH